MCFISLFIFFIYFISLFSPSTITSPRTQLNRVHTVQYLTSCHPPSETRSINRRRIYHGDSQSKAKQQKTHLAVAVLRSLSLYLSLTHTRTHTHTNKQTNKQTLCLKFSRTRPNIHLPAVFYKLFVLFCFVLFCFVLFY
jgi:hypothetical protein